eukprot:TRINITY_DN105037_c0_g1_i1.p1 TRINITY_DN105037_c0_g1~~TRINITY_DN105037_c0_g1_i1.p1  ORF type:complete len:402 (-),score=82.06 TRINITY_DN105037_c0_g1_i1:503-1708(-)
MPPVLNVKICIDRDLGIFTTKELRSGTCVSELSAQLAQDDPTGRACTDDFALARAGTIEALDGCTEITEELTDLEILTVSQPNAVIKQTKTTNAAMVRPTAAARLQLLVPSEVVEYRVLQRNLVKKPGRDPAGDKAVKLMRRVGSIMFTTGRTWTGSQGGEWVELDSFVEKPGWLLVQGPGFGIPGPIPERVIPDDSPPMLLRVAKPVDVASALEEDRDLRDVVLKQNSTVRDAKEWIALLFGLSDPRKIIVGNPSARGYNSYSSGNSFHIKSVDGLLEDSTFLVDAGFHDGDELLYVYTGDLEKTFEGKEPSWHGRLGTTPKPKAKSKEMHGMGKYPELQMHFKTLKLSPSAPPNSIKRHYRQLALECHPDKHPDNIEAATQQFQAVKAAYEAIRDKLQL